jgi:hypothetical protein
MPDSFDPVGKHCHLKNAIRAADGTTHSVQEILTVKRIGDSLGKKAYYVHNEGSNTFIVFPDEVIIDE